MAQGAWVDALWDELDDMDGVTQVRVLGEWITYVTQELLPELGDRRRATVRSVLTDPEWDADRLAEAVGTRARTIKRLSTEGRPARADVA